MGAPDAFSRRPECVAQSRHGAGTRPPGARRVALLRPSVAPQERLSISADSDPPPTDPLVPASRRRRQRVEPVGGVISGRPPRSGCRRTDHTFQMRSEMRLGVKRAGRKHARRRLIVRAATPIPASMVCRHDNSPVLIGGPATGFRPNTSATLVALDSPAPTVGRCARTGMMLSRRPTIAHGPIIALMPAAAVGPNKLVPARPRGTSWPPTGTASSSRTRTFPPGPDCGARESTYSVRACSSPR